MRHFKTLLKDYFNINRYEYQSFSNEDLNFVKNFQESFLIVPVERAANNYKIIRKKFYIEKIELSDTNFYAKLI